MHESHNIRKFSIEDAKYVYEIIRDNFMNIDLGGHTSKGIRLQIEGNSPINLIERFSAQFDPCLAFNARYTHNTH